MSSVAAARRRDTLVILVAGAALIALLAVVSGLDAPRPSRASEVRGPVSHVYDGDTIEVAGVRESIRLIGVDALDAHNETKADRQAGRYGLSPKQVRRWADEATTFLRGRLAGRRVVLRRGPEELDEYGRRLYYVHEATADDQAGADVNLRLLQKGLAVAYHGFPHPRLERYLQAEQRAWTERRGLWADATRGP